MTISAILWDFGGVLTSSPFEAFKRFEIEHGMPEDFIRGINATNPDHNAWAQFESSSIDLDQFDQKFADESAALGHRIQGRQVVELLSGHLRPRMVDALKHCKQNFRSSRSGRRTERHPATGDLITYNENAGATRVTIHSQNERAEWTESTALRFGERFYKLVRSTVAGASTHPFVYTFESWPDAEVLRRVLEYEESAVVEPKARWEGLKKLFGKE